VPEPKLRIAKSHRKDDGQCVLLIEAGESDAARILDELGPAGDDGFQVEWAGNLSSGIERLHEGGIQAVVLDLTLPDSQGVETFDKVFHVAPGVPILILSGAETEELARQAVQRGAQDYVIKNADDGYRLRLATRTMMVRRAAEAILLENEAAKVALDSIGEGVLRTDLHGSVIYLNRTAEQMTGWGRKEALGRPVTDVLRIIDGAGDAAVRNAVEIVVQEDKTVRVTANCMNCVLVRRDGLEIGIENTLTPSHDQDGDVTGTVLSFHDVTVSRARSLEMSHLAQHDFLTDLPNRMLFIDRLTQAIGLALRQDKQLAVMFVDLDRFKKINDSLGHGIGDKLLQSVAARLVSSVRRTDTVSRLGGDEFVILLSQVEHEEDAAYSARKILRALAVPHIIDNKSIDMNASIGVSTYPSGGADAESLINKADTAMYEAKQNGRNNYQFFRPDMDTQLAERSLLERDLRYALGRGELILYYQPKLNLQTGQITGMEALVRWVHPQRGLIQPAQFIPIAEECGLMLSIGRWVLIEACRQSRAWASAGIRSVPIAVNVSAPEFADKDFVSGVRASLIATGTEPANLELEVTESVLMVDAEATVATLGRLRAMGVRLAIDDFGTGYSSFTYLRRFPADMLKIHQSFTQQIVEDPSDASIVTAVIAVGKSLKQRVIAEGIETQEQLDFLQRQGCDEGQGYYFSRPIDAEQAGKLISTGFEQGWKYAPKVASG
jgi:diguanylate cyclase (GGDEF)-like protein/PAS domain S-box-containing protein